MPKYVLNCSCGRQLDIEPRQAGESLACECGATVDVPTLRKLRELPLAREASASLAPSASTSTGGGASTWGLRQGAMATCLIIAALSLAVAGLAWWTQPTLPEFDPAAYRHVIDQQIDALTPTEAWRVWVENFQPLAARGFVKFEHPATAALRQEIDQRRLLQMTMVPIAGICICVAILLGVIKSRRRGDKEARRH